MSYLIQDIMAEYTDRETGARQVRVYIVADSVSDLPSNSANLTYVLGSYAKTVDTGDEYYINSNGNWILQSGGGGGGGEYIITPVTVDLSSETWENRNFCYGSSNFVITCNKIVEIPEGAVSVSAEITFSGDMRADSCFQFFADANQVQEYDKTDETSYTNDDYADGWQSTSESKHILPYLFGRYAFEFAVARYPISNRYSISPSNLVACTLTFYCVRSV